MTNELHKGPGDPDGRRLALRRANATEEACRIAECLARALRRCGASDATALQIAQDLRVESVQLREKAEGRIESRLTTRTTGHPLLENRRTTCLYLDESGSSSMRGTENIFALGGVAMREED